MVCFEEADPFVPALATHVPYTMGFQTHLSLLTASTAAASYPSLYFWSAPTSSTLFR